jgi:hypothetical protein
VTRRACLSLSLCVLSSASLVAAPAAERAAPPPPTRRAPVSDTLHGTVVVDDYR